METVTIVLVILVIVLIILVTRELRIADKLANFRALLQPGDKVYFLDRTRNIYYPAVTIKIEKCYSEHTLWSIEVYEEDDDYIVITSELNLFNKKY